MSPSGGCCRFHSRAPGSSIEAGPSDLSSGTPVKTILQLIILLHVPLHEDTFFAGIFLTFLSGILEFPHEWCPRYSSLVLITVWESCTLPRINPIVPYGAVTPETWCILVSGPIVPSCLYQFFSLSVLRRDHPRCPLGSGIVTRFVLCWKPCPPLFDSFLEVSRAPSGDCPTREYPLQVSLSQWTSSPPTCSDRSLYSCLKAFDPAFLLQSFKQLFSTCPRSSSIASMVLRHIVLAPSSYFSN